MQLTQKLQQSEIENENKPEDRAMDPEQRVRQVLDLRL